MPCDSRFDSQFPNHVKHKTTSSCYSLLKLCQKKTCRGKKDEMKNMWLFFFLKLSEILRARMFFTLCVIINTFKPFLSFHPHLHVLVLSPTDKITFLLSRLCSKSWLTPGLFRIPCSIAYGYKMCTLVNLQDYFINNVIFFYIWSVSDLLLFQFPSYL